MGPGQSCQHAMGELWEVAHLQLFKVKSFLFFPLQEYQPGDTV